MSAAAAVAFGSEFQEDDADWFKKTGEPAPGRFATEEPAPVRRDAKGPNVMVWGVVFGGVVLLLVLILLVLLATLLT